MTNLNLTLDAIGNITAKTSSTDPSENVGTYTYHATKKHAVASTSNGWTFGYDANGNMNSYKGNSISWTSYNLPITINGAGHSSQFAYGPNRNRWRQIASYPSGTETTIYVGGILEKVTVPSGTAYRHTIGAGSAKVIYTRWSSGTINTKYVTADHLGSSTVVMDGSGASLASLSFGSYGARRGSAWTGAPSAGDWTQISNSTRQGFTGHEGLDNVNFVHMNGRVFEPVLGRFLSPDRVIRNVGASQSWGGYAYVEGRSLSWTDPSGWAPKQGFTLYLPKMGGLTVGEVMNQINQIAGTHDFLAAYARTIMSNNLNPQVRALANQVHQPSGGGFGSGGGVSGGSTVSSGANGAGAIGGQNNPTTTMLETVIVTSTHVRPDLGFTADLIRGMLDSRFEQFMFERYVLREGPYALTSTEFRRAVNAVAGIAPDATENVTTDDGRVLTKRIFDFPSGEFDAAFGDASIFFDDSGRAVGFYDFYNMNIQPGGDGVRNFIVERVREACGGSCGPFEITYGDIVRPTGP